MELIGGAETCNPHNSVSRKSHDDRSVHWKRMLPIPIGGREGQLDEIAMYERAYPSGYVVHKPAPQGFLVGGYCKLKEVFNLTQKEGLKLHSMHKFFDHQRTKVNAHLLPLSVMRRLGYLKSDKSICDLFNETLSKQFSSHTLREIHNQRIRLENFAILVGACAAFKTRPDDGAIESLLLGRSNPCELFPEFKIITDERRGGAFLTPDLRACWGDPEKLMIAPYSWTTSPSFLVFGLAPDDAFDFMIEHMTKLQEWSKERDLDLLFYRRDFSWFRPVVYQHYGNDDKKGQIEIQTSHCRVFFAYSNKLQGGFHVIGSKEIISLPKKVGVYSHEVVVERCPATVHPFVTNVFIGIVNALHGLVDLIDKRPRPTNDKYMLMRGLLDVRPLFTYDLVDFNGKESWEFRVLMASALYVLKSGACLPSAALLYLTRFWDSGKDEKVFWCDWRKMFEHAYYICWHVVMHSGFGRAIYANMLEFAQGRRPSPIFATCDSLDEKADQISPATHIGQPVFGDPYIPNIPLCILNPDATQQMVKKVTSPGVMKKVDMRESIKALLDDPIVTQMRALWCHLKLIDEQFHDERLYNEGDVWNMSWFLSRVLRVGAKYKPRSARIMKGAIDVNEYLTAVTSDALSGMSAESTSSNILSALRHSDDAISRTTMHLSADIL